MRSTAPACMASALFAVRAKPIVLLTTPRFPSCGEEHLSSRHGGLGGHDTCQPLRIGDPFRLELTDHYRLTIRTCPKGVSGVDRVSFASTCGEAVPLQLLSGALQFFGD